MQGCVLFQRGTDDEPFKFRVSKPEKDVDSTDLYDFIIHESVGTVAPYITGSAQVPAWSNVLIPFGRIYSQPALIMLKPSKETPEALSFFA